MDNNNENKSSGFSYTYSAKEIADIKKIRDKYTEKSESEDKMQRLRRLDASVSKAAISAALAFGIIGVLLLGFGMSLCMTELGATLSLGKSASMIVGVALGVLGGIVASVAYPVYNATLRYMQKRVAPEILMLTDELMK